MVLLSRVGMMVADQNIPAAGQPACSQASTPMVMRAHPRNEAPFCLIGAKTRSLGEVSPPAQIQAEARAQFAPVPR
jgi:hypothetical protein